MSFVDLFTFSPVIFSVISFHLIVEINVTSMDQ